MQEAAEASVLGDFNNAVAEHFSSRARFFHKDSRFLVETEGKDGKTAEFQIKYTFGISPLQQYLVEFPDGRVQALPFAWDTRPKERGGHRWFHLYPGENIAANDVLHWTGPQQNWNYMCSECHSTNVRKNYDALKDTFHTTFSEVSVGCEACHGPASGHLSWATGDKSPNVLNHGFPSKATPRSAVTWIPDPNTGSPAGSVIRPEGGEIDTCDRCHSRRGQFSEAWRPGQPLGETHLQAFLTSDLFEDDGQMKDEVFNSPFRQSKMFAKGVVCTDCHDPHSGELKAAGAEVCSHCHAPTKFKTTNHSGHAEGLKAPNCISCHMPARTYMVVDERHDHSFRIPRPDLTVKFGTPNACNSCHTDRDAAWAAAAVERWHGPVRKVFQNYVDAFHATRLDDPSALEKLLQVIRERSTPAVAKATALFELQNRPLSAAAKSEIDHSLMDEDPFVRIGALRALEAMPLESRWRHGKSALVDPVRAVRAEAASLLAGISVESLDKTTREAFDRASQDYIDAKLFNADRAEERANLAGFYARQRKAQLAEQEYLASIKLGPGFVPARVGLSDLYRAQGREAEAQKLLQEAILVAPTSAAPHHALGLSLVRQKKYGEAIEEFKRATELELSVARYAYVYGVALRSAGEVEEARKVFETALSKNPSNIEILAEMLRSALQSRDLANSLSYAERMRSLLPDDASIARLSQQLKQSEKAETRGK